MVIILPAANANQFELSKCQRIMNEIELISANTIFSQNSLHYEDCQM